MNTNIQSIGSYLRETLDFKEIDDRLHTYMFMFRKDKYSIRGIDAEIHTDGNASKIHIHRNAPNIDVPVGGIRVDGRHIYEHYDIQCKGSFARNGGFKLIVNAV